MQKREATDVATGEIETVRGVVYTWECDAVEHFTTAYYFKKLSTAAARLLQQLGHDPHDPEGPWTERCRTRFLVELRVGDVYHIRSGVVDVRAGSIVLGHRLFNSETGAVCTTFLQTLKGNAATVTGPDRMDWEEKDAPRQADAAKAKYWIPTSASMVRPEEVDWSGRLDLGALINQLSAGNVQCQNGFGMTPSYMRDQRRGYSTAEYQLQLFKAPPGIGTPLDSRSAVVHVGNTSIWFMHELYDRRDGTLFARLAQLGVHLDLDKRRPAPLPDEIRERATAGLMD